MTIDLTFAAEWGRGVSAGRARSALRLQQREGKSKKAKGKSESDRKERGLHQSMMKAARFEIKNDERKTCLRPPS
jgi:hypothetical protein